MCTTLRIKVTQAILNKAAYCGHIKENGKYIASDDESVDVSSNCAIALAVRDVFPDARVGPGEIIPFGNNIRHYSEIRLPEIASCFIMDFDNKMPAERKKMGILEFEVEVPDDVLQHAFPIESDLKEIFKNHSTLHFV